jgi:hypothetical protein
MEPITREASTFTRWRPVGPPGLIFLAGSILTTLVRRPGHVDLFGASVDGSVWISSFDDCAQGNGWGDWICLFSLAPPPPGGPGGASGAVIPNAVLGNLSPSIGIVALARSPRKVALLMLDGDGMVWNGRCEPDSRDSPTTWQQISAVGLGARGTMLTAVSPDPDSLLVFVVGKDGAVWGNLWGSSSDWGEWEPIGDSGIVDPCRRQQVAAVLRAGGRIDLFVADRGGRIITTSAGPEQPWAPWAPVGAEAIFSPQSQVTALSPDPDHLLLFAPAKDGSVWTAVNERGVWGPWNPIGAPALLVVPPRIAVTALARGSQEIELFVTGHDGAVYESAGSATGGFRAWTRLQGLSEAIPSQAIVAAPSCRPNRVDLLVVNSDGVIQGASRGGGGSAPVVAPPSPSTPAMPAMPAMPEPPKLARLKLLQGARAAADPRVQRHAILIGINQYVDPKLAPLKFCVNDVLALETTLRSSGFASVITLYDDAPEPLRRPTRENIKVELMTLCAALGPDDLVVVHFSCHGTLIGGKPYLVPANTRKLILEESAIAVEEVMRILASGQARRVIVLLDACHSGADIGRDISEPDLAEQFARNVYEMALGTKVLAGATANQEARERGDLGRGVFTSFVIEALTRVDGFAKADRQRRGFVTFDDLRDYVCNGVIQFAATHQLDEQSPNESGASTGDMMLVDYRRAPSIA